MKGRLLCLAALIVLGASAALAGETPGVVDVNPVWILPFVLLLMGIAILPFVNKAWWDRFYPAVSIGLGAITVFYYAIILGNPERVLHVSMDYASFIVLIGSLFVISGGIHIRIRGKSKPIANVFILAIGAIISNILGTTGASMILIRPYLRVNRYRIRHYHIVFFIFVVSNMGGALTPIGDPPLFLGYLKGIPFFWVVESLWSVWLVGMVLVLGVFFVIDQFHFKKLPFTAKHEAEVAGEEGEVIGLQNIFFLVVVLVSVFISDPPFLREGLMVLAAVGSYLMTHHEIHRKNDFTFHPVKEVAILFLGIFATMIPALDWLRIHASELGITTPGQFFWSTGSLSAVLDNAPTYLTFLSAATGLLVSPDFVDRIAELVRAHGVNAMAMSGQYGEDVRNTLGMLLRHRYDEVASGNVSPDHILAACLIANHHLYVQAISIGAVFFGACTYIGNGPNFMVKSIAEHAGIECPTFVRYLVGYALPILVPIFLIIWLISFRN